MNVFILPYKAICHLGPWELYAVVDICYFVHREITFLLSVCVECVDICSLIPVRSTYLYVSNHSEADLGIKIRDWKHVDNIHLTSHCLHTHRHTDTQTHTQTHTDIHTYIHTHRHTHTNTHTDTHRHKHTHRHTDTHTHTHTHTH